MYICAFILPCVASPSLWCSLYLGIRISWAKSAEHTKRMPVGLSITLVLIVSVHCFYLSVAKWDALLPFCILLLDIFTFFFLFYLRSALCEAFSSMGYTSYEALTVRSWFRCVLQMFIDQPTGTLAKTDAERTVGKCSHFPNVCSNDSILQNWQTFSANYRMYFCLYSFTFT